VSRLSEANLVRAYLCLREAVQMAAHWFEYDGETGAAQVLRKALHDAEQLLSPGQAPEVRDE